MLPSAPSLVSISAAIVALGVHRERARELVDEGKLRFVFDLKGGNHIPYLRFWLPELTDRKAVRSLSWAQALSQIIPLGMRQRISSVELARICDLSLPFVMDRCRVGILHGALEGSRRWIEVSSVRQWLWDAWLSRPEPANHFASPEAFSVTGRTSHGARGHGAQEHNLGGAPISPGAGPGSLCAASGAESAVLTLPRPQKLKLKAFKGSPEPVAALPSG